MNTILIFDDDPSRKENAVQLQQLTNNRVEFINLSGRAPLEAVLESTKKYDSVDLVIVDHFLTNTINVEIGATGPIIVPNIRRRWPASPVLAVTAARDRCISEQSSEVYEEVFGVERFSQLIDFIPVILDGYSVLKSCSTLSALTDAMDCGEVGSGVLEAFPTSVRKGCGELRFANEFYRWFRNQFHKLPGFLLDESWTSIKLGVDPEYFREYRTQLNDAMYTGPLAFTNEPRWWKHKICSFVLPDDESRYSIPIPEAAAKTLGVDPSHTSKCERCSEKWPEVLGLTDESPLESHLVPLHRRCSDAHSKYRPEPFYEELRVMIGD